MASRWDNSPRLTSRVMIGLKKAFLRLLSSLDCPGAGGDPEVVTVAASVGSAAFVLARARACTLRSNSTRAALPAKGAADEAPVDDEGGLLPVVGAPTTRVASASAAAATRVACGSPSGIAGFAITRLRTRRGSR